MVFKNYGIAYMIFHYIAYPLLCVLFLLAPCMIFWSEGQIFLGILLGLAFVAALIYIFLFPIVHLLKIKINDNNISIKSYKEEVVFNNENIQSAKLIIIWGYKKTLKDFIVKSRRADVKYCFHYLSIVERNGKESIFYLKDFEVDKVYKMIKEIMENGILVAPTKEKDEMPEIDTVKIMADFLRRKFGKKM